MAQTQLLTSALRPCRKQKGSTGEILLQLLEMRLDNTVFRLGFAPTMAAARQLVNHGHITVDGKEVNIASFSCKPGQQVRAGVRLYWVLCATGSAGRVL